MPRRFLVLLLFVGNPSLAVATSLHSYPTHPLKYADCSEVRDANARLIAKEKSEAERECFRQNPSGGIPIDQCYKKRYAHLNELLDKSKRQMDQCVAGLRQRDEWERAQKAMAERDQAKGRLNVQASPDSSHGAAIYNGPPSQPQNCAKLRGLRDKPLEARIQRLRLVTTASEHARGDIQQLIRHLEIERMRATSAYRTAELLQYVSATATSMDILLSITMPTGALKAALFNATNRAVDIARTSIDNTDAVKTMVSAADRVDVWLAFGSLLPDVGSYVSLLKNVRDTHALHGASQQDRDVLRSSAVSLSQQLQGFEAQIASLRDQSWFLEAIRNEINRRCDGNDHLRASSASIRLPPQPAAPAYSTPSAPRPMSRAEDPDCAVLRTPAGMAMAVERWEAYEALSNRCP